MRLVHRNSITHIVLPSDPLPVYSLGQILKGFNQPRLAGRELNQLYHSRIGTRSYNPDGIDVFSEDWDNLVILDSFRYDTFSKLVFDYDIPGELERRISGGSCTPEFLAANADRENLHDTVYVTATTMLYREGLITENLELNLHAVVDVWQDTLEGEDWGVEPEATTRKALEAIEKYPNKRLILHYIQPHIPFIGPTGEEYFGEFEGNLWKRKMEGDLDVSDEFLWECYRENAAIVLEEMETLFPHLEGKTVVTADHGQMIGDRSFPIPTKEYGHPCGVYTNELVEVPWFVHDTEPRRRIVADPPEHEYTRKDDPVTEHAKEHLRELGYVD